MFERWKQNLDFTFRKGSLPVLLYANRQEFGTEKRERPMHMHETLCELLLCYRGTGIYHVDDHTYSVSEGDMVYYNAKEHHELLSESDTEIGTYCLGFGKVYLADLGDYKLIPSHSAHVRPCQNNYAYLRETAEQILERKDQTPLEQFTMQNLALSFLLVAIQLPESDGTKPAHTSAREIAALVKTYINANYTRNITLKEISAALSFSESHIAHSFKQVTGYSPIEYVIRCRIGYAQTLLISSDMSVTSIAMSVGYDNANYFQTLFKKIVGTSPLQYRKQYLKKLKGQRDQS